MASTQQQLGKFYSALHEISQISSALSILHWDQQVVMPDKGVATRAKSIERLAVILHQRKTDPELLSTVEDLHQQLDSLKEEDLVNVREIYIDQQRAKALPLEHVAEKSRIKTESFAVWAKARPLNDFKACEPFLTRLIELSIEETDLLGYQEHRYDPLLQHYERGGLLSWVKPLLLEVAEGLKDIVPVVSGRFSQVKAVTGDFPAQQQSDLGLSVMQDLLLTADYTRLDPTTHPFQSTIGNGDIRLTTRYDQNDFVSGLMAVIHESGHALYERGLRDEWRHTPSGRAVSLGIHEYHSRFWENIVGRSKEFAVYLHKKLEQELPQAALKLSVEGLWQQLNLTRPSLIRVEADETTYSLHIVIRMLLEEQLVSGELSVKELPEAFDALYQEYLGIKSDDLKDGVMQDTHWFSGMVGYFPTYALGNVFGGMFLRKIKQDIPEFSSLIEAGDFAPIIEWQDRNISHLGMKYYSRELVKSVTGEEVSAEPFLTYLREKHNA